MAVMAWFNRIIDKLLQFVRIKAHHQLPTNFKSWNALNPQFGKCLPSPRIFVYIPDFI